jgi:hypothetical protein
VVEPNASTIPERIAAIKKAHKRGLRTYAMLYPGLCENWFCPHRRDPERFPAVSTGRRAARTVGFGVSMAARSTGLIPPLPLQLLAAWLAVWLGRVLQEEVDYLKAEKGLLREKPGTKRVRLTDAERRRLATLGKSLGRKGLAAVATIASPETIMRWYRQLQRAA